MDGCTTSELSKLLSTVQKSCSKAEGDPAEVARAVEALNALREKTVSVTWLQETGAGKKLKLLSKHSNQAIAKAAAGTIEAWKECVKQTKQSSDTRGSVPSIISQKSEGEALANAGSGQLEHITGDRAHCSNRKPKSCGDKNRDKTRELLAAALNLAVDEAAGDPCRVAVEIEEALFKQNGSFNTGYKTKYRSISFNLKDPNNPTLRRKVLAGEISGEVLVSLTPDELASDERRGENEKIREAAKRECERGQTATASTDQFQCGKCKQRKCTYFQMQTRSADEPMTTFVTCTNCGNKWKFC